MKQRCVSVLLLMWSGLSFKCLRVACVSQTPTCIDTPTHPHPHTVTIRQRHGFSWADHSGPLETFPASLLREYWGRGGRSPVHLPLPRVCSLPQTPSAGVLWSRNTGFRPILLFWWDTLRFSVRIERFTYTSIHSQSVHALWMNWDYRLAHGEVHTAVPWQQRLWCHKYERCLIKAIKLSAKAGEESCHCHTVVAGNSADKNYKITWGSARQRALIDTIQSWNGNQIDGSHCLIRAF